MKVKRIVSNVQAEDLADPFGKLINILAHL